MTLTANLSASTTSKHPPSPTKTPVCKRYRFSTPENSRSIKQTSSIVPSSQSPEILPIIIASEREDSPFLTPGCTPLSLQVEGGNEDTTFVASDPPLQFKLHSLVDDGAETETEDLEGMDLVVPNDRAQIDKLREEYRRECEEEIDTQSAQLHWSDPESIDGQVFKQRILPPRRFSLPTPPSPTTHYKSQASKLADLLYNSNLRVQALKSELVAAVLAERLSDNKLQSMKLSLERLEREQDSAERRVEELSKENSGICLELRQLRTDIDLAARQLLNLLQVVN
ncbi:hypothetical protein VKT23_019310 [Stygiomarasmius scandens]|uniref:Uncharacterized protein n=1 Tax=Marasmiellus scandens TaxID=2682957 RepID=A0ABR1ILN4_9AGAR